MSHRPALPSLLMGLLLVAALPAHGDNDAPPRARPGADTPRAKAQEAERERLVAKLRAEAPKVDDLPPPSHRSPRRSSIATNAAEASEGADGATRRPRATFRVED